MSPRDPTKPSPCKSCGAPMLWVEWASGKRMPVAVEPVADGDIVLTFRKSEGKLLAARATELDEEHLAGRKRYVSHFASCPQAKQYRRAQHGR